MTRELAALCRYECEMGRAEMVADTPRGRRFVVSVVEARFDGPRFKARQRGDSATDWLLLAPDGTAHVDVRMTLKTHDDALVYVQYSGRGDWSGGVASAPVQCAFLFETGDERYAWMNATVGIGWGVIEDRHIAYDVYELR